jgi:asparagine synthase (glutamine-hydrolysing)
MCGIAGILAGVGERVPREDLQAMATALRHRGPDDEGFHFDGPLGFAHRRLSILDLTSAGHQPMANEDGTVWIVYNGQLFGFEPLRERLLSRGHRLRSRTDTEILVHLYEEAGDGLLEEIDGMFAFALWDARRRRLLLARDRLGIKPLYYAESAGRLAFASEIPGLLALGWVPRDLDSVSLVQYLYQSSVPGPGTVFRAVRALEPATKLVVDGGAPRSEVYWRLPRGGEDAGAGFEAAAAELDARLQAAVRSHLVADVPVGTFLSGGLDSAAVTRAARRATSGPLHTFSVRFEGVAPALDEAPDARRAAEALDTVHHELVLGPEALDALPDVVREAGEPFAISSGLAVHHLARFARETVKVVLTGDGADEILAGYPWRHEPELGPGATPLGFARGLGLTAVRSLRGWRAGGPGIARQLGARLPRMLGHPDERYAEIVSAFTPEELGALVSDGSRESIREAWSANPVRRAYAAAYAGDEVNRRLRADLATTLVDEMLTKVDRFTMAAGLEARVPFLDRALVEWAFAQPGRYKVRGGSGKRLLRHALAPKLPETARRAKRGFSAPLGAWLRGPARPLLQDVLSREAVSKRRLFRPEAVERLVRAHLEGRGDHSRRLYTLLVLELWLEQAESAPAACA